MAATKGMELLNVISHRWRARIVRVASGPPQNARDLRGAQAVSTGRFQRSALRVVLTADHGWLTDWLLPS